MNTVAIARILKRYDAWEDRRSELSGLEASGDYPDSEEWHQSDDEAGGLLRELVEALREGED